MIKKGAIECPELYFNRRTGELYNRNESTLELTPVKPGTFPIYEDDDYEGYFYSDYFFHPAK